MHSDSNSTSLLVPKLVKKVNKAFPAKPIVVVTGYDNSELERPLILKASVKVVSGKIFVPPKTSMLGTTIIVMDFNFVGFFC
jgi:hypothetical protein